MAHLGHVEHTQQSCCLLRGAAGVQNDQRALRDHPDAAAVFHRRQTLQNGFICNVKALAAQRQRKLHSHGSAARRMTAQKSQRHGISAVVHLAGKLFCLQKGDILRVRHHQLAAALACGHDQLAEHRLGLLRRGDADAFLAHDACCQSRKALHRAAHTVRADRGDGAHRHAGQHFRKARIRQFHHGQRAARCAKAVGRSGQLRCILRQGFGCGKGIRSQSQQALVHRGIIDADALRQRAAPGMVQAGMDPLCVQDGRQQTGRHGLACRACHAHELHLLHRRGERGAQLLGGGKTVRQGGKILICLFDGHWLLLITMVEQQSAQRHEHQRRKDARQNTG